MAENRISIYNNNNPCGYRYNVSHPKIRELYDRYCAWKHIAGRPLTDAERMDFEKYLDKVVRT